MAPWPSFWREYVPTHGQLGAWPADLDLDDAPPLVRELQQAAVWLEQERVAVAPRLVDVLRAAVARS